jgi:O-antigen ligase
MENNAQAGFFNQRFNRDSSTVVLLICGVIFMYWSTPMFFVGGQFARLGSLVLGFSCVMLATYLRARGRIFLHRGFLASSGTYFVSLLFLTKLQQHDMWREPVQLVFCLICLALFWAGYLLAYERRDSDLNSDRWSFAAVAFIGILALLTFLRFVNAISFHGTTRGYGETTLNPVGIAYANTCFLVIFVVLSHYAKYLWTKSLFILAASVAFFVVGSSASRGAIIWGACALLFFYLFNRSKKRASIWKYFYFLVVIMLTTPIILIVYRTNFAVAESFDVLLKRFESLYYSWTGQSEDLSSSAREYYWEHFISIFNEWVLLGQKYYIGYPHNQWLEISVRFGLLGIPMLITSLASIVIMAVMTLRKRVFYISLEYSVVVTLFLFGYLQSMTSLNLQMNRVLWLGMGYVLGCWFSRHRMPMKVRT